MIIMLLRDNPSVNYTIDQLSDLAFMSASRLKIKFRHYTQTTIHQFALNVKMEHAKMLIEEEQKTLAQIAADTGFANVSNFIKAFKKKYSITPGQWSIDSES